MPAELGGMFPQSLWTVARNNATILCPTLNPRSRSRSFTVMVTLQIKPSLQLLGSTQPSFIFAGKAAFAFRQSSQF